jgi:phosphatidate cytidylyltransferase
MISRELGLRIISAVVLAVVVLTLTWQGGIWFRGLAALIALLIYYEFSSIVATKMRDVGATAIGGAGLTAACVYILIDLPYYAAGAILIASVLAATPALWQKRPPWIGVAIAYAGFSGLALAEIRGDTFLGLCAMIFVFAVVWATDILAYFCGRAIGGPKLAPSISPGKTWSGAIFGAAAGVAAGLAVVLAVRPGEGLAIPLYALVLSIASQAGDLYESWVKRRFGVKDSSHLIPGHGGVMDRVDGLVFAAFAAFLLSAVLPQSAIFTAGGEPAVSLLGH